MIHSSSPATEEEAAMDAGMGDGIDDYYWDYLDPEVLDSLYGGGHDGSTVSGGSSSLDAGHSSHAAAAASNTAIVMERHRRRRLNDKLYALRSVVPTITKMDKASVIKDAIEYIQQLQQQERQMLAEISLLESAPKTHDQLLLTTPSCAAPDAVPGGCAGHAVSPTKKVRRALSFSSAAPPGCCAASPPVEALEVRVSTAGHKVLVVSIACRHRRDAIANVCRALEGLRLAVIAANVTSASGTVTHTALVQTDEMHQSEMKEMIEIAIAQLDVIGSPLSSMSY